MQDFVHFFYSEYQTIRPVTNQQLSDGYFLCPVCEYCEYLSLQSPVCKLCVFDLSELSTQQGDKPQPINQAGKYRTLTPQTEREKELK